MVHRYLYPAHKRLEILSACFAGGFGVHIWATSLAGEPLAWAGIHNGGAVLFGQAISLAALVHAAGVRINGRWKWSPILRLAGMSAHSLMFGWLAVAGFEQTAGYTYGWVMGLLIAGAFSAFKDTRRALGWEPEWNQN